MLLPDQTGYQRWVPVCALVKVKDPERGELGRAQRLEPDRPVSRESSKTVVRCDLPAAHRRDEHHGEVAAATLQVADGCECARICAMNVVEDQYERGMAANQLDRGLERGEIFGLAG